MIYNYVNDNNEIEQRVYFDDGEFRPEIRMQKVRVIRRWNREVRIEFDGLMENPGFKVCYELHGKDELLGIYSTLDAATERFMTYAKAFKLL